LKQSHKTILLWVVLILMFVSIYQLFNTPSKDRKKISFSEFIQRVEQGKVDSVKIKGREHVGKMREPSGEKFVTYGIVGEKLFDKMKEHQVSVEYEKEEQNSFWQSVIISWLPMLFLFFIFFFFMRQLQAGGGKAMSFGKSKARLLTEHHNKVTFSDVAGIDEAKDELQEIIEFLKDPKKFTRLGGRIPRACSSWGRRGPGRRCWPAPSPARRECPSSASRAPTSWRCSWAWARAACETSSSRGRSTPPASSSSTRSTPWDGTAVRAWAAGTTSASRR
jgi:cell division protease FtsH